MKLIQIMKRGANKILCVESFTSATTGVKTGRATLVRLWLAPGKGEPSRYWLEMNRMDAMRLRDNLNKWFPEGETYLESGE